MTFEHIHTADDVAIKRGTRVQYHTLTGTVTGTRGDFVRVQMDGEKVSKSYRPKDLVWPAAEADPAPGGAPSPSVSSG